MKKITHLLYIPSIALLVFMSISGVDAKSLSLIHLADNQKIIVKQKNADKHAVPIGESGFYETTVKNLKDSSPYGNVDIYPVVDYRPTMAANDPLEPQSYLNLLDAQTLWDNVPDTSGQTIAVIDTGFALNHQDLAGRWATNPEENGTTTQEGSAPNCTSRSLPLDKSCNNLDDDVNGYVDDWRGWDFSHPDNDPVAGTTNPSSIYASHATEVSGLTGVTGNNSLGSASLNWYSKILPLQMFTDSGTATTIQLAEALSYAISQHVDVINLSLGSANDDPTVEALVTQAKDEGIIVVAAAGNCGGSNYSYSGCNYEGQMLYPSVSHDVIAVGATDLSDTQASFSSRGTRLDVTAPGSGAIISSQYLPTNGVSAYSSTLNGTSFATPIVSGLMAILKAEWPDATFGQLRAVLIDSAYKTPGMNGDLSTTLYGFGRIQPVAALTLSNKCKTVILTSDINCDGNVSLLDLSLLASQWEKQYTGRTDTDLSGLVDLLDLSTLASQWGK